MPVTPASVQAARRPRSRFCARSPRLEPSASAMGGDGGIVAQGAFGRTPARTARLDARAAPSIMNGGSFSTEAEWPGRAATTSAADPEAAVKVFARKGYFAARVSEIASKAGVADGTIYLYFRNKEDILVSLFDERHGRPRRARARGAAARCRARPPACAASPSTTCACSAATATWPWSSRSSCASPRSSWSASPPPGCRTTSPSSAR